MDSLSTKKLEDSLILSALICYLALVAMIFLKIRANNDGHFFYALDDPYIHLAPSEQLAHGHYGLNPGEATSPSSSILWPFLLVPFAHRWFHVYLPLLWNVLFGSLAVCVIAGVVARLPGLKEETGAAGWMKRLATAILLMLTANLVSLTFMGMEHTLQVLLAIVCAAGLIRTWDEGKMPWWCLAAAAVGPMVRYENIAITVAVCVVLAGLRQWGKAAGLLAIAALPMMLFGLFLRSQGLPMLPMSVMVKGRAYHNGGRPIATALQNFSMSVHAMINMPIYWPIMLVGAVLTWMCLRERDTTRRFILAAGVLVAVLQVTVGRFGWFNRYEVYALIFVTLILLRAVKAPPAMSFSYLAIALFYLASQYVGGTRVTAAATRELYEQQYQMHRFINDFHQGSVAVNDLGLTSYQRSAGTYILDVYGLASPEASKEQNKSAEWMKKIVAQHGVDLAILYPQWFRIPASWTPVAKICNSDDVRVIGERCVVFYSTEDGSRAKIREEAVRFAATLPAGVKVWVDPQPQEISSDTPTITER
jgi:hypothetical protein